MCVDLAKQTLNLEGQMLLHSMSSSPKSLEETSVVLCTSPLHLQSRLNTTNTDQKSEEHTSSTGEKEIKYTQGVEDAKTIAQTNRDISEIVDVPLLQLENEKVWRSLSLELDLYTPPRMIIEGDLIDKRMHTLSEFHMLSSSLSCDTVPTRLSPRSEIHFLSAPTLPLVSSTSSSSQIEPSIKGEKSPTNNPAESEKADPKKDSALEGEKSERKGNIRKEKDELMLMGNGIISPSPKIIVQPKEADEELTERPIEESNFFARQLVAAESALPIPSVEQIVKTKRPAKDRRTSFLHLFTVCS